MKFLAHTRCSVNIYLSLSDCRYNSHMLILCTCEDRSCLSKAIHTHLNIDHRATEEKTIYRIILKG